MGVLILAIQGGIISLTDLLEKSKPELETKTVQQIISIAGDGNLRDSSVTSKPELNYQDMIAKVKKYKTAFASYSSKDSSEVYSRVHGMTKLAPDLDIFLSRLSLKSSVKWEEALLEHVPNKDVFYLFWSRNALKSEWVDKEWRLALRERELSYIDPVPLESPKLATPPPELSALHFDDIWVALKHENDYIDTHPR